MSFIAFPVRLEGKVSRSARGALVRCERVQAIDRLVEVMAHTPTESWAADRRFGLPLFMGVSLAREGRAAQALTQQTVRTLNLSLEELGVTDFRVESIVRTPAERFGEIRYQITLRSTANGEMHSVGVSDISRADAI